MGLDSGIEWTHATWNPWRGCHKISEGCLNCYMFREQKQYGGDPNKVLRSKTTFKNPLKWAKEGKLKEGSRIFTCSWSDFFIEEADEWRKEAWDIIRKTFMYWYLILTKRSKRMLDEFTKLEMHGLDLPMNVVWMVTAENQRTFDMHVPILLNMKEIVPKIHIGLSVEPMIGRIDASKYINSGIDWIIIGSESGRNRRECKHDDVRFLRDQAKAAGIPVFIKQLDINGHLVKMPRFDEKVWNEIPENLQKNPSLL
jgi:protein gp37